MLRLADVRDRVRVVDDQLGCPTFAPDIAVALIKMARQLHEDRIRIAGVVHLAGPDDMTWCGFARAVFEGVAARGGKSLLVDPISTAEYPTAAARPANSRLSTAKLGSTFDISLPRLESSLATCLDRLMQTEEGLS
jgi:dTDP-4-dehydrorhamnose reductase